MNFGELLRRAVNADALSCLMAAVALLLVAVAIPFRRGGVDARFIIQVFSILATIGTIPKIVLWAGAHISKSSNPPPELGGTDMVLVSGGLVAIVWSGARELLDVFVGDRKEPSWAAKLWSTSLSTTPTNWLSKLTSSFSKEDGSIDETPEARAARVREEQSVEVNKFESSNNDEKNDGPG